MRFVSFVVAVSLLLVNCSKQNQLDTGLHSHGIQGLRFDPSYYYNINQSAGSFSDSICKFWHSKGINTLFFKAYDPLYGAVYKTSYKYNASTDYAKDDLLKLFIKGCHKNNIKLIVWLPVLEHKGAWDARPDWRLKDGNSKDLIPEKDKYALCFNNPEVKKWWTGFVDDILNRYPEIDGIDLAEPASVWKNGITCECSFCIKESTPSSDERFNERSKNFSAFLLKSFDQIQTRNKTSCLTLTITADRKTEILPFDAQRKISGIDLDSILSSNNKPAWFSCEILWQQWADLYDDPLNFNPEWTERAAAKCLQFIDNRTHCIAHVELTPLGPVNVSPQEFATSIKSARKGGAVSVDFYDAHLADSLNAWESIKEAWNTHSEQSVYIYHDSGALGVARQIGTLFGHFDFTCNILPVDSFSLSHQSSFFAYVGANENSSIPENFKTFACTTKSNFYWINQGIDQIKLLDSLKGLRYVKTLYGNTFNKVTYKNKSLFKEDSIFSIIDTVAHKNVKIHAFAKSNKGEAKPYILQSDNFWYVADCPVDYMVEGGRHIAFADLLHNFTRQDHQEQHTALVRIEDICVLTDPKSIRNIVDYLYSEKVPFSLAVVPFYVDPEENSVLSLSDRPELVNTLRYAVSKGGTIVMHGSTHQYRGLTTADYEFWDELKNAPLFEDSRDYVNVRIMRGLDEFRKNKLYPVIWETPHYGASQLDYSVIYETFNAEYGRHQVIDQKGFDQLVPFFIKRSLDNVMIIPENIGYVPNDNESAAPLLTFGDHNLAVRDGFASFFFHPWIKLEVLKDIVNGLRNQGYVFKDIKNANLQVQTDNFTHATGSSSISINADSSYIHSLFITKKGKTKSSWFSSEPINDTFSKSIVCPSGEIFVIEKMKRIPSVWDHFSLKQLSIVNNFITWLFKTNPLQLSDGNPARVVILWNTDSLNQSRYAWRHLFNNCGIDPDTVPVQLFVGMPSTANLLVVPSEAAKDLSMQQTLTISQWVASGNHIILEKSSSLANQLGIQISDTAQHTTEIVDEYYSSIPIHCKDTVAYSKFSTTFEQVIQYRTPSGDPLVSGGFYGKGDFLYFATDVSKDSSASDNRFPFFTDLLERQFNLKPVLRNSSVEIYFDPATRENASLEDLVKMWKKNGVSVVHVAGWEEYPDYTFEYNYFTKLLHQFGIIAYVWFDLPHISEKFYLAHPEWREIRGDGKEALIGWRKNMNLTNDTCRAGAFNGLKRILMSGKWDGITITGKMFEGNNPAEPHNITPFNKSFRNIYQSRYGYDPLLIVGKDSPYSYTKSINHWNDFCAVRDSVESEIINDFISFINRQYPSGSELPEIIITRPYLAMSESSISFYNKLSAKYLNIQLQLTLQQEQLLGKNSMIKYIDEASLLFKNWKPMLEIDLDNNKPESFSIYQLCGTELQSIVAKAAHRGIRFTIKTESSIFEVDFRDLSYSTASVAQESLGDEVWEITSPIKTEAEFDAKTIRRLYINNIIWPGYDKGRAILPSGKHHLSNMPRYKTFFTGLSSVAITNFGGTLNGASTTFRGINLSYTSTQNAPLVLSRTPKDILVDGIPVNSDLKTNSIILPGGKHNVTINMFTLWDAIKDTISLGLSGTIVMVSFAVILTFVILYITSLITRNRRSVRHTENIKANIKE
jgi:uncharacterized protein YdaL